jgi:formylglycine-generating enzyme required for sulfatase activity
MSQVSQIETAFVSVDGASFLMGSEHGAENERPIHRVRVDTFELGARQVTNREYDLFVQSTGHAQAAFRLEPEFNDSNQPVVAVSWFDAVGYCEWLSRASGRRCRLPTEAEWEFAARGGVEGRRYPWGDAAPDDSTRTIAGPEPVGRRPPNAYGLYDMCENVHEWCSDWYAADYYALSPAVNPSGPQTGARRVSRGGSWRHQIKVSRCAARSSIPPAFQYTDYGFRVARA